MDKIVAPRIRTNLADLDVTSSGRYFSTGSCKENQSSYRLLRSFLIYLPMFKNKTELTRSTIFQVLNQSGRLPDFPVNPQQFMDKVVREIKTIMNHLIIKGIVFEKLEGIQYEMTKFKEDEHKLFLSRRKNYSDRKIYLWLYPLG